MAHNHKEKRTGARPSLRKETLQAILAVLFLALGLVLTLSAFGRAGIAGENVYRFLRKLAGIGYFFLPVFCFFSSAAFLRALRNPFPIKKMAGVFFLFLSGLGILDLVFPTQGGLLGRAVSVPLVRFFEVYTSVVLLAALFLISLLVIFDAAIPAAAIALAFARWKERRKGPTVRGFEMSSGKKELPPLEPAPGKETETEDEQPLRTGKRERSTGRNEPEELFAPQEERRLRSAYVPPPLSLLEADRGKPGVGDIKANANIIKRTLQNFGIEVEMDEVSIGPTVTRYALKPAENVRLSKIVALQRELELSLAAHPIRIEAPIPGKSLVGIELPNHLKATVGLATMLGNPEFASSDKPLIISLGKDLSGKAHFANLSKMPHLLIAGATGSGKSVTIHTIVTSLLFRNAPEDLKFILIDPKRVELTLYNSIPHLLTPVITDAKKTILALKWAAKEMDRRYDILESESVRDIHSYHKNILGPELKKLETASKKEKSAATEARMPERLPYVVIVIDELADIMTVYPRELEAAVVRLAQMSRATGIHLVLSTQRPSVNVITGLIKANIPARIALQVASQVDSRTILDTSGAEKLLGAGDMLFLSGEMSKPARLQSAFISEAEVKKVTSHLASRYKDEPPQELHLGNEPADGGSIFDNALSGGEEKIDDELYEEAREAVVKAGKASTSYLQRKLRIGYSRAARLMDVLEERGIIGAQDGSKPREVIGAAAVPTQVEGEENDLSTL